jgi:hypothetical protein
MSEALAVGWAFTVTITVLAGWVGFNRPSWSRTYTSIGRYRLALAAHIAVYLFMLLALYAVLRRVAIAVGEPQAQGSVLLLALVLTLAVRSVPPLFQRLRDALIRAAGVPEQAKCLARYLAQAPLQPDAHVQAQAEALLAHRGIGREQDWLAVARPMRNNLLQAAHVYLQLRGWKDDSRLQRFAREASHELEEMLQRFDRLSLRVARTLSSIESVAEMNRLYLEHVEDAVLAADSPAGGPAQQPGDPEFELHVRRVVDGLVADACEGINVFYRDACMLVARGVMTTQATRARRDAAVAHLGFAAPPRQPEGLYGVAVYAACALYAGLWIFFLLLPPSDTANHMQLDQLIAVLTINVLGAIAIAVVPKFYWGFANSGLRGRDPVPFIVGAGFAATAFATAVNLCAGVLVYGGMPGAWRRLVEAVPALPSYFITAAAVAWLIQDHRWAHLPTVGRRRLLDAAVLGGAWVLATVTAVAIARAMAVEVNASLPALAFAAFVFGAVMGLLVAQPVRSRAGGEATHRLLLPSLSSYADLAPALAVSSATSSQVTA